MVERAENWRGGRWWIVIAADMRWSYGDGLPWWCWEWGMMKKRNLRKGFGGWKRGAMRNEEEIEHWKRRTRPLKRKCKFRTTPCVVRKFRIPMRTQTEIMVLKICRKNEFAQGLHKVRTRFAFLWNSHKGFWEGTESMFFLEIATKAFSHKGCVMRKFRTTGSVVWKWLRLGFFLPYFALLSAWLHSSSFPTWMLTQKTNSKHIRTALKSKIKIKTWKNTRKN